MRKIVCALSLIALFCLTGVAANASHNHRRRHHTASSQNQPAPLDLSPIDVEPYVVPTPIDPADASFQKRMNLENGVLVRSTRGIERQQVSSRDLFILQITQSLEGGFDSVNMYDKGVASWGIMQWSAHEGSLAQALIYIKRRLLVEHQAKLWQQLFVANGMDVDGAHLYLYGKPVTDAASARLAFRGASKAGSYDPNLVNHWASVLARAGRQPAIQALQIEYASHIVEAVLQKRLAGLPYHGEGRTGVTAADLAGDDPFAEALVFTLWTNNPRHAFEYVENAARAARSVSAYDDPAYWPPGAFSDALIQLCLNSRFGNWQQRAQMIEARALVVHTAQAASLTPFEASYQSVLAARKSRRFVEMASRHQVEERGVTSAMEIASIKKAKDASDAYEKLEAKRKQPVVSGQGLPPSAEIADGWKILHSAIEPGEDRQSMDLSSQVGLP